MSVKYISYIFEKDRETKGNDRLVLLALADSADDNGGSFAGKSKIAQKVNCTPGRVREILRKLESAHKIIIQEGAGIQTKHGWTNRYTIVAPEINCTSYLNLCAKIGVMPVEFKPLKEDKRGGNNPEGKNNKRGLKSGGGLKSSPQEGLNSTRLGGLNSTPKPSVEPSGEPEDARALEIQDGLENAHTEREELVKALSDALKVSLKVESNHAILVENANAWTKDGNTVEFVALCVARHQERLAWKTEKGGTINPPTFTQLMNYAMEVKESAAAKPLGYDPNCEHGCNAGYIDTFEADGTVTRTDCACRVKLKEKVQ